MLSLYVFQEMAISDVLPRIRTHLGAVFTNYVDNILPIIDHIPEPFWHLRRNVFTEIMENLQSVEISSTIYLPSLFNIVYERPHLVENATEQKRGKRLRLRPFKKLLELFQNTLLTKESALPVSCLWDRGDLKVLNHTI